MSVEAPIYRICILFEAGSGVCLWAADDVTRRTFGHAVDPAQLPLDEGLRRRLQDLTAECESALEGGSTEQDVLSRHVLFGYEPQAAIFAPRVEALAVALREALGPQVLIEHEFETPADAAMLEVRWNRRWLTRTALGSLPMAALTGWFSYAIAFDSLGDLSPSGRWMLAAMFLAFALLFVGTALTYVAALRARTPVLTLDSEGLLDRRLTQQAIPWSAIRGVMPLQRGAQLMLVLDVVEPRQWSMSAHPLWALNRASARLTSSAELAVKVTGLEITLPALLAAIQRRAR